MEKLKELFVLRQKFNDLEKEMTQLFEKVLAKKLWHPPEALKDYAGERLWRIAIVVSDSEGSSAEIELLDTSKNDIWLGITEAGYLKIITVFSREYDDYEEEVFDELMDNGSYYCYDTDRCLHGFLWIDIV